MRGLGAFFIKRKLDPKTGQKDHVYRAVLDAYMAENLKEGESLEFFIEGGRSRSGKSYIPKGGLLSVVVNSLLENEIENVYIVPVAISYEKLIDGNFVNEQLGRPKAKESFSVAAKAIWTALHSNFGSVRVDFCKPFSLKEYLHGSSSFDPITFPNHLFEDISATREGDKCCVARVPCVACAVRSPSLRPASSTASL